MSILGQEIELNMVETRDSASSILIYPDTVWITGGKHFVEGSPLAVRQGLLYRWTEHSILVFQLGRILNSDNAAHSCKTLRKYLFRLAKGKSMVNFYIVNAQGQNLANSESCPILRLF